MTVRKIIDNEIVTQRSVLKSLRSNRFDAKLVECLTIHLSKSAQREAEKGRRKYPFTRSLR